ncbi:phage tail assembly chaperone [Cellulosilyticum sp. I15G10I2]|uniref:phage tail assembly chaperone n=1 Tax=Cellulosilyticum sp. I15G10I2 TaxID=1892843 RepID=UPI00085BE79E|nr:phage portal protein [Cellulosilyticum sp. I15G10I2]
MKSLKAFLNPIQVENQKIIVSKRFLEDGKPVEWEVKAITSEENEYLLKKHMKKDKKGNETFDKLAYMNEMVASCVVYPDLLSADLQKYYGAMGATQLLNKMLLVGEFAVLSQAVQEISGLQTENELIEEAKN